MTDVTCAIISDGEGKILIVQRGAKSDHPFKWEFPGGKRRQEESLEDCVVREIMEELALDIIICGRLNPVEHDYGIKQIRLIPFVCETLNSKPLLREHIAYRWITPGEVQGVELLEADIKVAEQYLKLAGKGEVAPETAECGRSSYAGDGSPDESELKDFINRLMSMKEADWLAGSALASPDLFAKLLEYSFCDDHKLAFRASWILTKVCDRYPEIILPHLGGIIESLPYLKNKSVIRSFMRILSFRDMNIFKEEHHGALADYCLNVLNSSATPVAIKAYAMEVLYRLTVIYPRLGNEVAASISSLMEEGSPAIASRGRSVLRKINGITSDS